MQNHNHPAAGPTKLLPFLRTPAPSSLASPDAPLMSPMATRLVRPVLVQKPVSLPTLSPSAALAHDARNALTSLALLSGLLGEPGVLAAGHMHYAADLHSVTCLLTGLLNRFASMAPDTDTATDAGAPAGLPSDLSQPGNTAGESAGEQQPKSAGEAIKHCARLLRIVAGSAVEVHISSENGLPPLAIGEEALARVLTNLVKNASEAMPGGGQVQITARRALSRTTSAVLVHVSDNGPGIPAHAIGYIFEPGFSSKRAVASVGEPCGLGLAIVRDLVESSGGAVRVASTRRRGTTFELRLPCLK